MKKKLTDLCKKNNIKLMFYKFENKYRFELNNIICDWWPESRKKTLFISRPFNLSFTCYDANEAVDKIMETCHQSLEPEILNDFNLIK